jgi:hypothetical protein
MEEEQELALIILVVVIFGFLSMLVIMTFGYRILSDKITKADIVNGAWECQEILYIYPGEEHPSVMVNADYKNHPLIQPDVKSWFCKYDSINQCVADTKIGAYDQYCLKWEYVRRIDTVLKIPFMYEYLKHLAETNSSMPTILQESI